MENLALIVLIIFSLVGLAAIFFTTFGTLLIFIGALIYAALTDFSLITVNTLLILLTLYLAGEALEYIAIIIGAKKFGASNKAIVGAVIGGFCGAILGGSFLGIGIIFATFLGIFCGAFFVEMIVQKDLLSSLKSATGSVIGRVGSILAKVAIAIMMLAITVSRIL